MFHKATMKEFILWLYFLLNIFSMEATSILNTDIQQYIVKETPNLKKICAGTNITSYTWKVPVEGSKKLTFRRLSADSTIWFLKYVDNEIVINTIGGPNISFDTKSGYFNSKLYLNTLYPFYPKVTGVDILQFLVTLGFICHKNLKITDVSDLTRPYKLLYGTSYYGAKIKGIPSYVTKESNFQNQNQIVNKNYFLKCSTAAVKSNYSLFHTKVLSNFDHCQKIIFCHKIVL